MLKLNQDTVHKLFTNGSQRPYFHEIQKFLSSDVVVGLEIVGENSIA